MQNGYGLGGYVDENDREEKNKNIGVYWTIVIICFATLFSVFIYKVATVETVPERDQIQEGLDQLTDMQRSLDSITIQNDISIRQLDSLLKSK